jgi:hypothetical protein
MLTRVSNQLALRLMPRMLRCVFISLQTSRRDRMPGIHTCRLLVPRPPHPRCAIGVLEHLQDGFAERPRTTGRIGKEAGAPLFDDATKDRDIPRHNWCAVRLAIASASTDPQAMVSSGSSLPTALAADATRTTMHTTAGRCDNALLFVKSRKSMRG